VVAERVERGAEDLAAAVERLARGAAAGAGVGSGDLDCGGGVALTHLFAYIAGLRRGGVSGAAAAHAVAGSQHSALALGSQHVACASVEQQEFGVVSAGGGQLSHADSSLSASGIT
jgi:hypothetical protein